MSASKLSRCQVRDLVLISVLLPVDLVTFSVVRSSYLVLQLAVWLHDNAENVINRRTRAGSGLVSPSHEFPTIVALTLGYRQVLLLLP